uniref:hypothetical protein n=1 Tax=Ningiella ruwaisensis TaxID=2364274 RepID=UPI0010A0C285|nr:hypothetical protein [Ningiella ruwaisensis]
MNNLIKKQVKQVAIPFVVAGFALSTAFGAVAQVTEQTSDKTLLEGKDKSEMFEVAEPTARLDLVIADLAYPVQVRHTEDGTELYAVNPTPEEEERILSIYEQLTGDANATVKNRASMDLIKDE